MTDRRSPSGEHLGPDDKTYRSTTYQLVLNRTRPHGDRPFRTVTAALVWGARHSKDGDTIRILEIPRGEPADFDGYCVAETKRARGL